MSSDYEKGIAPKGLHRLMLSTRVTCLCAHRILAISNKVGRELIETVGFGKKIDTVYVPVDYHRFADAAKGNIRQELGLDQSQSIITSIGHAVPVKGWDIAIKAFAQVYRRMSNVRMLLVGDKTSSEYYDQLTRLIKQYEMEENIKFTGKRDDIPEILKASDLFILPSRSEGQPAALVEAMASGLPCLGSRVGGVPEVINHEENGLLFERESVRELAGHLVRLIEDQSLRTRIASQASIRARMFSMKAYVDKVFECYNTLLGNHTTREQASVTAEA
jgi:glycosyltransferase involved in cell wall biosynthesis